MKTAAAGFRLPRLDLHFRKDIFGETGIFIPSRQVQNGYGGVGPNGGSLRGRIKHSPEGLSRRGVWLERVLTPEC